MDYNNFITDRKKIERITIEAPMKDATEIMHQVFDDGFYSTSTGPKRISLMDFDTSIFQMKAERIIND